MFWLSDLILNQEIIIKQHERGVMLNIPKIGKTVYSHTKYNLIKLCMCAYLDYFACTWY